MFPNPQVYFWLLSAQLGVVVGETGAWLHERAKRWLRLCDFCFLPHRAHWRFVRPKTSLCDKHLHWCFPEQALVEHCVLIGELEPLP